MIRWKKSALALLAVACVLAIAFAGVFVFFPIQKVFSFTPPP
ncbi:MAG: hypothetical protein QW575_08095 [Thermoproteota archaeon]